MWIKRIRFEQKINLAEVWKGGSELNWRFDLRMVMMSSALLKGLLPSPAKLVAETRQSDDPEKQGAEQSESAPGKPAKVIVWN